MDAARKPLLALDVDGVLAITTPIGRPVGVGEGGRLEELLVFGYQVVYIDRQAALWMAQLAERFEIVWATTWLERANEELVPQLGLEPLQVIGFTRAEQDAGTDEFRWKLPAVERYSAGRALAWVDDELREDTLAWAAARAEPTLVLRPDWAAGLNPELVAELLAFADTLEEEQS